MFLVSATIKKSLRFIKNEDFWKSTQSLKIKFNRKTIITHEHEKSKKVMCKLQFFSSNGYRNLQRLHAKTMKVERLVHYRHESIILVSHNILQYCFKFV